MHRINPMIRRCILSNYRNVMDQTKVIATNILFDVPSSNMVASLIINDRSKNNHSNIPIYVFNPNTEPTDVRKRLIQDNLDNHSVQHIEDYNLIEAADLLYTRKTSCLFMEHNIFETYPVGLLTKLKILVNQRIFADNCKIYISLNDLDENTSENTRKFILSNVHHILDRNVNYYLSPLELAFPHVPYGKLHYNSLYFSHTFISARILIKGKPTVK